MDQRAVWDAIAPTWTRYRTNVMRDVYSFAATVPEKTKLRILDVGCGNGRNLPPFRRHALCGVDFSPAMIRCARAFCRQRGLKVRLRVANITKLPYRKNTFDVVLSIAMLHHVAPGAQRRALAEMRRVLAPGGRLFLTVWYKRGGSARSVPWLPKTKAYQRYYYFFSKNELVTLMKKCGFTVEQAAITAHGKERNLVVTAAAAKRL